MNTARLRQLIVELTARVATLRAEQAELPCPIRALFICDMEQDIEVAEHTLAQRVERLATTPHLWKHVPLTHTAMGIRARQSVTRRWLNRRRHLGEAEIAFLRSANRRTLRYRNQGIQWEMTA